jgi:DNA-directed RNA polymerase subunit F
MIKDNTIISMSESVRYLGKEERDADLKGFMKKFIKLSPEDAVKLRKEIDGLKLMKVKQEHIAKIMDFLPEKAEDLSKIFNDINLDEDETKKILAAVKEYI